MRQASKRDDQRLRQIWMSVVLRRRCANARFWRSRSYAPTNFRGTRDAFLR
jgi:type IV secretion system protein VirB3